jgi:hypothetical protein
MSTITAPRTIEHSIDIAASPDEVWRVLTATNEDAEWNPFMTSLTGDLSVGGRLAVTIRPRKKSMTFKPTVVAVEDGRLIRWQGSLGVRGIFDGEHELLVEPTAEGTTRLTQRERFTGLLIPFMRGTLRDTLSGFAAMNEALLDRTVPTPVRKA